MTDREDKINSENVGGVVNAALKRVEQWCVDNAEWAAPMRLSVKRDEPSSLDARVVLDSTYLLYTISFFIGGMDMHDVRVIPTRGTKLKSSVLVWLADHIAEVKELCLPVPVTDGRWWADENYYPIRPVWDGEDIALKPEDSWTVVDGTTGEPVKECLSIADVRSFVRSTLVREHALDELFGRSDFSSVLDAVLKDLLDTNKKLEKAHQLAPQGPAKAIVAGLHSDLFNTSAEFRKYVEQLKGMVKESAILEAHDPSSDHVLSYFGLKEAAIARLRRWIEEVNQTTRLHAYLVLDLKGSRSSGNYSHALRGLIPEKFVVEVCPTGKTLRSETAHFNVNISMPTEVYVRAKDTGSEYTKDDVNAIRKELIDVLSPHPDGSGLWWADADFYPLRPVWEGETKDMENGSKPLPHWTVVDGATGDMVKESIDDDGESTIPTSINRENTGSMVSAAKRRIDVWCEEQSLILERKFVAKLSSRPANKIWLFLGREAETFMTVTFSGGHGAGSPNEPHVTFRFNDAFDDDNIDWAYDHKEELEELASPHPRSDGAWWVREEDMYLLRPVYEGETVPPFEGWVMVDPVSYEPINENALHETKSWSDGRWIQQTLDAVHEEVAERMGVDPIGTVSSNNRLIALMSDIESDVFDLLTAMGLPNDPAEKVSRGWLRTLVTKSRKNASTSYTDMIIGEFKELLSEVSYYPQAKIKLVSGRDKNGKDGTFVYEQVACSVIDLAGHIGMTIEENPSAVWAYDPETYELLNIPTYKEARFEKGEFIARLRDIDEGKA